MKQNKSEEHLQVQHFLHRHLPGSRLEVSLPTIGRVADLLWPEHHLVIEIQCSPLSCKEWRCRSLDYGQLGYTLIWLLHERRFNRRYLTPCEVWMQSGLLFYTDIDASGRGAIFEVGRLGQKRLFRFDVDLSQPRPLELGHPIARFWHREHKRRVVLSFQGDLFNRLASKNTPSSALQVLEELMRTESRQVSRLKWWWKKWCCR